MDNEARVTSTRLDLHILQPCESGFCPLLFLMHRLMVFEGKALGDISTQRGGRSSVIDEWRRHGVGWRCMSCT